MDKERLRQCIIDKIEQDVELALAAAKAAHEAAINEETQPDNKYDTLALESSYIAQGHANRAQQLKKALDVYKKLEMQNFAPYEPFYLTALVGIEYEDGRLRQLFLGPEAGGLKVDCDGESVVVITPGSPLCGALLGKQVGDVVSSGRATDKEFEIIWVC
ncbi:transcription elongation factor GreAB [uncultured Desulfuromonas sp.]|uniref:transcription elongation factor GreAB n=1 Tax=uncultured Desulfuromonas sp. TaxID=181013 RepID=UPI002AAB5FC8|nr:transcription elongation factor GreAB [uncultured Desulfuromonas sp.]